MPPEPPPAEPPPAEPMPAGPAPGPRERRKARTREAIRHHALRLFAEQGYARTSVEQIAQAAGVSHMTFFRYFPSKEDVCLNDHSPLVVRAFVAQPAGLSCVQALRGALHEVMATMTAQELEDFRRRQALVLREPQLRAAALVALTRSVEDMAQAIAGRTGRDAQDISVTTLTGALMGVMVSAVLHWTRHPEIDMGRWIDRALEELGTGPW